MNIRMNLLGQVGARQVRAEHTQFASPAVGVTRAGSAIKVRASPAAALLTPRRLAAAGAANRAFARRAQVSRASFRPEQVTKLANFLPVSAQVSSLL